jgi:hypothetical protein
MKFKRFTMLFLFLAIFISGKLFAQKEVIIVYDPVTKDAHTGVNPDLEMKALFEAEGYVVHPFGAYDLSKATPEQLDSLKKADLIYIGRAVGSMNFASPNKEIWNAITTPIITSNMWALRSSRMNWFNSINTATTNIKADSVIKADILKPNDPVFEGISSPVDWWKGHFDLISGTNGGNGTVMATKAGNGAVVYVRFTEGLEFYPGSVDAPAGPRVYMGNASDGVSDAVGKICNYFGYTEEGKKVFFREVARLTTYEPKEIVIVYDPATIDKHIGMNPDLAMKAVFESKGYKVYPFSAFDLSKATPEQLDTLKNADLIYIGRAVGSMNFASPNKEIWNAIKVPIITSNMWGLRSSRMNWFNSINTATTNIKKDSIIKADILLPDDPVFKGISTPVDWWKGHFDLITGTDGGNGTVLATKAGNGAVMYVRFNEGVEFYPGSVDAPAAPRVFIGNASDGVSDSLGKVCNYFGYTDQIKLVFFREVARLMAYEPKEIVIVYDPVTIDKHIGMNPDLAMKAVFESKGYKVYPFGAYDLSKATPEQLDTLKNADLIYIGRAVGSMNFASPNKEIWNAITAPIITSNMWGLRSSRMNWFNSTNTATTNIKKDSVIQADIVMKDDPIFKGITSPFNWWTGHFDLISGTDGGNGTVMATKAGNGPVVFVRFKAGVEFYKGSVDMPAGQRVYIGNASDGVSDSLGKICNYFAYTDKSKPLFFKEVSRLVNGIGFTEKAPDILVDSIAISGNNVIKVGETTLLIAVVTPVDVKDSTIKWSVDNATIATIDQTGLVTGIAEGKVLVTATANDASGTKATYEVTINKKVGTNFMQNGLEPKIYPNPAVSNLFIEMEHLGSIEILDLAGRKMHSETAIGNKISVNVTNLNKGIYMLKVTDINSKSVIKKITIE